jgi:hypothetical protein
VSSTREELHYPKVFIEKEEMFVPEDGEQLPPQLPGQLKLEDPWFHYVREFVERVPDIPRVGREEMGLKRVRIALIDDGVDVFRFSSMLVDLEERFERGASFDTSADGPGPEHASVGGHGTVMAKCILQMCRWVTIIPIRLGTDPDPTSFVPRPEPSSAAKV